MIAEKYKKMAGTAAVYLSTEFNRASPVESDGSIWSAEQLQLNDLSSNHQRKAAMPNVLALEGLEDYDPPTDGDLREVDSIGETFLYVEKIRGWVQLTQN